MKEFFISPDGRDIVVCNGKNYQELTALDIKIIKEVFDLIQNKYPKALARLKEIYGQNSDFKWLMVRRFIKCNWGNKDERVDLASGHCNFEYVQCPLRGECLDEDTICNPEEETRISHRELDVIQLIALGLTDKEIATRLFISVKTVENHRSNIHQKLNTHSKAEIVNYAHKHNLIK